MKPLWPRPDFLATTPRTSRLAWLWLATAVVVFAVTAQEVWAMRNTTAALSLTLARAESSLKKAGTGINNRAETDSPRGALTVANPEAPRKAQAVVRQLDQAWGQIFSTLEMETPPGLQWLMFDRSADSAELRVEGLAPNGDVALDLVARLSARKAWSDVVMSRLQAPETSNADNAGTQSVPGNLALWRFEIKARFDSKEPAAASQGSQ